MSQQNRSKSEYDMLAKLALKYGLATKDQIAAAFGVVRREEAQGSEAPLGEVLLEMGIVTEKQLQRLRHIKNFLLARKEDRKLAKVLLEEGLSSSQQIEEALKEQEDVFRKSLQILPLPEILTRMGVIDTEQIETILHRQNENDLSVTILPGSSRQAGSNGPGTQTEIQADESQEELSSSISGTEPAPVPNVEVEVRISDDGLSAVFALNGPDTDTITVDLVLSMLKEHGITHGIVDEETIYQFLESPAEGEKTLEVARGVLPIIGKDGQIEYFFETDPLKVGAIKAGERIDYKDRGQVPQVNEGELLARLTPTVEGRDGCNIFGEKTRVYKPRKLRLYYGEGVTLSEDGLEASAKRAGQPKLTVDGRLIVEPEYVVKGDVDLETGHVDFAGSICVYGTVQDGFRVKGGSLSAKEILKADVDTVGDIVVNGGIIGARIKTQGHVKAKFIQGATIEAKGDVLVDSSIIDSRIQTCGTCLIRTGKVFSSSVQAKRGIEARQIGSEQSKSCQLVVGLDELTQSEMNALKERMKEKTGRIARFESALQKLRGYCERMELRVGQLVQKQDRVLSEMRALEEEAQELETVNNPAHMEQVKFAIQELQEKYSRIDPEMTFLQDKRCTPLKARLKTVKAKLADIGEQLELLKDKFESLSAWAKENPPVPVVKVHGVILAGTQIRAAHSSVRIKNELEKVIIQECRDTGKDTITEWRLAARPLRET